MSPEPNISLVNILWQEVEYCRLNVSKLKVPRKGNKSTGASHLNPGSAGVGCNYFLFPRDADFALIADFFPRAGFVAFLSGQQTVRRTTNISLRALCTQGHSDLSNVMNEDIKVYLCAEYPLIPPTRCGRESLHNSVQTFPSNRYSLVVRALFASMRILCILHVKGWGRWGLIVRKPTGKNSPKVMR